MPVLLQRVDEPDILEVSEDDTKQVIEIIRRFEGMLLDPEKQDYLSEFHFGCTADRIAWDDVDSFYGDGVPSLIMSIDIEEMSGGRFGGISPDGLHMLMFQGTYRTSTINSFFLALQWERDRATNGEVPGLHLVEIEKHLVALRDALFESCAATDF